MAALNPLQFKGLAPGQLLPPGSGGYNGGIPSYATSATTSSQSGIPELRPKVVSTLDSALSGELPPDVVRQISQNAAEFGVASGMPGSEFSQYRGLRDLGLTSLSQINRAQDLLAPGYRESTTYSGNPQGGPSSHTSNWNVGSVPGTLQRGGGGAPPPMASPEKPNNQSLVGDFLAKYLPGSRGGGTSTGMAPMGSTPEDLRLAIPGFGTGLNISQNTWGQQPVSSGSMYMGADNGLDQEWFEDQMAGDPLSDFEGSFTGDINYDYGDFDYA